MILTRILMIETQVFELIPVLSDLNHKSIRKKKEEIPKSLLPIRQGEAPTIGHLRDGDRAREVDHAAPLKILMFFLSMMELPGA